MKGKLKPTSTLFWIIRYDKLLELFSETGHVLALNRSRPVITDDPIIHVLPVEQKGGIHSFYGGTRWTIVGIIA